MGLDEALLKQRQQEKQAFKQLIDENVKLEMKVGMLSANITDLQAKHEVLLFDLDEQKEKNAEQSQRMADMEKEIKKLKKQEAKLTKMIEGIMASKKSKKNKEKVEEIMEEKEEKEKDENIDAHTEEAYQSKITDLQVRLKRLAKEDHEKNCRLTAVDAELSELRHLLEEMEKHIEPAQLLNIRKSCKESNQKSQYPVVRKDDRANVVDGTNSKESKVCIIL